MRQKIRLWVHHGADDDLIHPSESINMIENLRRKQMKPVPRLTIYDGVGHHAWEAAYANPEVYTWLLAD